MIVRCENCQTEFSLNDGQVTAEGVTVRCSVCAFVFRVEAPEDAATDQPWQINTIDDLLFTAPDVATLHAWIEEGRLHPDDKVSKTGRSWLRLGDIPEFSDAFVGYGGLASVIKEVEAAAEAEGFSAGSTLDAMPDSERSAVDTLGPPPKFAGADPSIADPLPVAPDSNSPSMLGVATQHAIRPLTAPTPPVAASHGTASPGPSASDADSFASHGENWTSAGPPPSAEEEDVADEAPRAKRGSGGIFALLGAVAAVGVMFGVPDVRNWLLNLGEPGSAEVGDPLQGERPEIVAASAALVNLGTAELSGAESSIQRVIDSGSVTPAELTALRVAQADLLATRSLLSSMRAVIVTTGADEYAAVARQDLDRGARIFDAAGVTGSDPRTQLARARIRLAERRDPQEVKALLPASAEASKEMALVIDGAALWQDPKASVPPNLIADLRGVDELSALGRSVLALALLRSGDEAGARNVAERMLARAADQSVARAVAEAVAGDQAASDDSTGDEPTTDATEGQDPDQEPDQALVGQTTAKKAGKPAAAGKSKGKGKSGGRSLDRLLDKGCGQVDKGQAAAGVATLLKAFDLSPRDLDVLVCLGRGYAKQGNGARASHFYTLALARSPKHRGALKGAAQAAAARGATAQAVELYERLLRIEPTNAKAKLYVAKHGASAPKP